MALPSNVGFGTVVGRLIDSTGNPLEGQVEFLPSPKSLRNATATPSPVVILPKAIAVPLVDGAFSQVLIATDDTDNDPNGWTYRVSFRLTGATVEPFNIEVPEGGTVDIASVMPVAASNGTVLARNIQRAAGVPETVFWGVITEGAEPTPPVDGKIHYAFRVSAP